MRQYKRLGILLLLITAFSTLGVTTTTTEAYAQAPDKEFTISVGETLTFSGRGVSAVSVGLDNVADAKVSSNGQIIVFGKQPGTTTININGTSGQKTLLIRVVGTNPLSLAEEVREVLGPNSGVDVRVVKGRVLLEGEVAGEKFKRKVEQMVNFYPSQLLNFTTYREAFVEGARMVAVEVYFVQLSTTNRDELGVKWGQFVGANYSFGTGDVPLYYPHELESGVTPDKTGTLLSDPVRFTGGDGLTSYFSLVGQVNMVLEFLVTNGLVKTLNHGTVITEAGTLAEYHSGGTLLVKLEAMGAVDLREIPYGLKLKVTPVIDVNDQVKLEVKLDYSELDYANGVEEIPALRNTSMESVVNTVADQTVMISSQASIIDTSNETGLWMLSKIPIMGWLFKSRTFLGTGVDNAIFITPRVYEPGKSVHEELIDGVFKGLIRAGAEPADLPNIRTRKTARSASAPRGDAGAASGSGGAGPSLLE